MCSHIDSMRAISVCFFLLSFILYGNYVAIIDQLMKREWTNTLRTMNRRKQTRSHTSDRPRANKLEAACMRHFLYHTAKNSTHFEEIVILFLLGIIGMQCIDVIVSKWNEEKKVGSIIMVRLIVNWIDRLAGSFSLCPFIQNIEMNGTLIEYTLTVNEMRWASVICCVRLVFIVYGSGKRCRDSWNNIEWWNPNSFWLCVSVSV